MITSDTSRDLLKEKKLEKEIEDLKNQKLNLEHQIDSLKKKIANFENEKQEIIKNYEAKINDMKDSTRYLLKAKDDQISSQKKYYEENFMIIPLDLINKKIFLKYMIQYYINKQLDPDFLKLCELLYFLHGKSYDVLRSFLPVVPGSLIRAQTSQNRKWLKNNLIDINNLDYHFLDSFYKTKGIHITFGGDAASIKPEEENGDDAVYTYMIIPVKKEFKPFPVKMQHTTNGSSNAIIVSNFFKICKKLEDFGFIVDFISTDGDVAFDSIHINWFESTIIKVLQSDGSFIEKINSLKHLKRFPSSDFLHLAKDARDHMLDHIILLDPKKMKCLNMELFRLAADFKKKCN